MCAALIAGVVLCGCTQRPRYAPLPPGTTVVALGDSLTFGTGAPSDSSFPVRLAARTQWHIVNGGVPGDVAAQGCARLPELLDEHHPRLVLVMLGGNDFLRRRPESGIRTALEQCAASAAAAGVPIVLLAIPKLGMGGFSAAPLYAETGKALSLPVLDPGIDKVLANARLRTDPIHPNAAGYAAIAENVEKGLREAGFLPAR